MRVRPSWPPPCASSSWPASPWSRSSGRSWSSRRSWSRRPWWPSSWPAWPWPSSWRRPWPSCALVVVAFLAGVALAVFVAAALVVVAFLAGAALAVDFAGCGLGGLRRRRLGGRRRPLRRGLRRTRRRRGRLGGRAGRGPPARSGRLRELTRVGDDLLERGARVELRDRRLLDLHRLARARVAAGAGAARDLLEGAEPGDADLPTAGDLADDDVEDGLERVAGGLLAAELRLESTR